MIQPIFPYLLLKRVEKEQPKSGIVLPDEEKKQADIAEVIAVPLDYSDNADVPNKFQKGQKVIFKEFAPQAFQHDGVEFLLCHIDDVLAVITI